jgi:hypothetical protein
MSERPDLSRGTIPAEPLSLILEDEPNRFNAVCSWIAAVMLGGLAVIYLIVRLT